MRNFRRLVLGLVLLSSTNLGWGYFLKNSRRIMIVAVAAMAVSGCESTNPAINEFAQNSGFEADQIHIVTDCTVPTFLELNGPSGLDVELNQVICQAIRDRADTAARRIGLKVNFNIEPSSVSVGARAGRNYRYRNASTMLSEDGSYDWVETPVVNGERVDARTLELRSLTS